jgi:hypothetical protein
MTTTSFTTDRSQKMGLLQLSTIVAAAAAAMPTGMPTPRNTHEISPTLAAGGLMVTLDLVLPRPLTVVYTTALGAVANLTAPTGTGPPAASDHASNPGVDAATTIAPATAITDVSMASITEIAGTGDGTDLCTPTVDVGCIGADQPGGPKEDKLVWGGGKDVPRVSSGAECCAMCKSNSSCTAWVWNGPNGNHYCYGYEACVATQPATGGSQMTGSKNPIPELVKSSPVGMPISC